MTATDSHAATALTAGPIGPGESPEPGPDASHSKRGPWPVVSWAAFLACSWTWCIGMFLPLLLIRDFGAVAFLVFLLPNALGAAAMGRVLRQGRSEAIVSAHRVAILAFSIVTVAFHLAFVTHLPSLHRAVGDPSGIAAFLQQRREPTIELVFIVPTVIVLVTIAMLAARPASRRSAAVLMWLFSASVGVLMMPSAHELRDVVGSQGAWSDGSSMLGLVAVCTLGFALCPYLDATFHRARQGLAAGPAGGAFALGFGLLFPAMIAVTLFVMTPFERPPPWFAAALIAHILAQAAFTCGAHVGECVRLWRPHGLAGSSRAAAVYSLGVALLLASVLLVVGASQSAEPIDDSPSAAFAESYRFGALGDSPFAAEYTYRSFMAFYGLVFPAYVWICLWRWPRWFVDRLPRRLTIGSAPHLHREPAGSSAPPAVGAWVTLAAAVVLAAPFYYWGFMEATPAMLLPGVAIVVLSRVVLDAVRRLMTPPPLPEPPPPPSA